jgi:hypothetical protein
MQDLIIADPALFSNTAKLGKEPAHCYRLRTTYWTDGRSTHVKRTLTFLARRSAEGDWLRNDAEAIGAQEAVQQIVNLNECKDGIYELIMVNPHKDWETGLIEEYNMKLISIEEKS